MYFFERTEPKIIPGPFLDPFIIIGKAAINSARYRNAWSAEKLLEHQKQVRDAYVPVFPRAFERTDSRSVYVLSSEFHQNSFGEGGPCIANALLSLALLDDVGIKSISTMHFNQVLKDGMELYREILGRMGEAGITVPNDGFLDSTHLRVLHGFVNGKPFECMEGSMGQVAEPDIFDATLLEAFSSMSGQAILCCSGFWFGVKKDAGRIVISNSHQVDTNGVNDPFGGVARIFLCYSFTSAVDIVQAAVQNARAVFELFEIKFPDKI